jgi:hypothetical protein
VILTRSIEEHLGKDIGTALAKAGLPLADAPAVIGALATGNMTSAPLELASPSILAAGACALQVSYAHSFRLVYLVSITFGVLGVICSILSREVWSLLTSKVDIKLEEGAHVVGHADSTGGHVINHDNHKKGKDIDMITEY